ncbi:MAG: hypothetical protein HYY23_12140 [Verrucomicrobia bacterium]|nr:hypothetical protein [Verrucomicrobiota bacterium]
MKNLDPQKLDVVNKTRSNLFGWRGQFTPEFNPLEFEGIRNQPRLSHEQGQEEHD